MRLTTSTFFNIDYEDRTQITLKTKVRRETEQTNAATTSKSKWPTFFIGVNSQLSVILLLYTLFDLHYYAVCFCA